jgi:hypothetical protein
LFGIFALVNLFYKAHSLFAFACSLFENKLTRAKIPYVSTSREEISIFNIVLGIRFIFYLCARYTRKNAQVGRDLLTSCNKVVVKPISGCVCTALFQVVVTSLEQVVITLLQGLMTVTDILQVVPTRLIQAVHNKLLRACCHQLVNNLLRADNFVGTTCCESLVLINFITI